MAGAYSNIGEYWNPKDGTQQKANRQKKKKKTQTEMDGVVDRQTTCIYNC